MKSRFPSRALARRRPFSMQPWRAQNRWPLETYHHHPPLSVLCITLSAALVKVQKTLPPIVHDPAFSSAAETWPLSSPACKCLAQLPLPQMLFRRPMSSVSVSVAASVSGFEQRVVCTAILLLVLSLSPASYILSTCLRFAVL
jgi:hypothetical protein